MESVLRVGEVVDVGLEGSPTTGYTWTLVDDGGGIVIVVGDDWEVVGGDGDLRHSPRVGGGARQIFRLKGVAAGAATLRFRYRRGWEDGFLREETVNITVE